MYQYIHQNIVDNISKIEKEYPVDKLTYKNIKIWPLIKSDINFQFIQNRNIPSETEIKENKKKTLNKKQVI